MIGLTSGFQIYYYAGFVYRAALTWTSKGLTFKLRGPLVEQYTPPIATQLQDIHNEVDKYSTSETKEDRE